MNYRLNFFFLSTLIALALLAISAPSSWAATSKVSLTVPASATDGQPFSVGAKLSPKKKGVKVSLQQQQGKKWKTIASGKTDKSGVVSLSETLAAGAYSLRAQARIKKKTRNSPVKALTVSVADNPGGGTDPGGNPGGDNNGKQPLFNPPGRDLEGQDAANAIIPYLANSTFTDCVPGYPNCIVEERYGYFENGNSYYCRLTNNSGSDIINGAHPYQIVGASMKADGSWGVTLRVISYGDAITYYNWWVDTAGVAYGAYWNSSTSPYTAPENPSQRMGPLQWVRGARDCSY